MEFLSLIVNEGEIINAFFVEAPRQRNSREENKKLKKAKLAILNIFTSALSMDLAPSATGLG